MADIIEINKDGKQETPGDVQKRLMVEHAQFEQELAKADRLMKGRSAAFSMATEATKAMERRLSVDELICEAAKIEKYLSEGADSFVKACVALNDIEAQQEQIILDEAK